MKRFSLLFFSLFLIASAQAQDIWVYSTNGSVEKLEHSAWSPIRSFEKIKLSDSLRMEDGASLTLLDRKNDKLYAIQAVGTHSIKDMIDGVRANAKKHPPGVMSYLWDVLRGKNDADEYRHAAGVVYRDGDNSRRIAGAIKGFISQIPISYELIDENTLSQIGESVEIGQKAFFKVSNQSKNDVFVNFIAIDSEGNVSACIPVSLAQQITQLLIPAGSVVVLDKFPIRFSEPKGLDTILLIASTDVFDVQSVVNYLNEGVPAERSNSTGLFQMNVQVR
jgi:hypothetical protein